MIYTMRELLISVKTAADGQNFISCKVGEESCLIGFFNGNWYFNTHRLGQKGMKVDGLRDSVAELESEVPPHILAESDEFVLLRFGLHAVGLLEQEKPSNDELPEFSQRFKTIGFIHGILESHESVKH